MSHNSASDRANGADDSSPRSIGDNHFIWPVQVVNEMGMHARPASLFVETANRFPCEVTIRIESRHRVTRDESADDQMRGAGNDSQRIDGKSILQLLSLSAEMGTVLTLETRGTDSHSAIQALGELVRRGLGDEMGDNAVPKHRHE